MGKPEPLWKALNCSSLMMGIGAVMGANGAANLHGNAEFFPASVCLVFVIFAQLAANCFYRYHDMVYGKLPDERARLRAGRKHPGYDKTLFYRVFAYASLLMAMMVGITLVGMGGWWFALVGVFIFIAGWLMVAGSTPIILTSWSSLFSFILFGPVAVISTGMIQSLHEATDPLSWFDIAPLIYMGLSMGFLAANANLVYNYATYFIDKYNQRDTFAAVFGRKATRIVFLVNSVLALVIYCATRFDLQLDHPWVGMIPAIVSFAINIFIWWKMKNAPRYKLGQLAEWVCLNMLVMGLLGTLISAYIGTPDDSYMEVF